MDKSLFSQEGGMKSLRQRWVRYGNKRRNREEFRKKKATLRSYPYIAYFDVTNACPLSCPLCPTGSKDNIKERGMMSFDTFKGIYDGIGPYLYELHLYNWGEPFLNKSLADMVRHAKAVYNPDVVLSTTLTKVSEEWAEEVVKSGVDMISVSIDGATQEVYEKYRVGGNIAHVLGVLKYMAGIKRACGLKTRLRWQFIPMRHNEHEIEQARSAAKEIGVEFRTHRIRLNVKSFDEKDFEDIADENKAWLPDNPKYIRHEKNPDSLNVCRYLWSTVVFNWDGSVIPCCKIHARDDAFADSVNKGFMSVWNGPAYVRAREIFNGKPADGAFICQRCYDRKGLV